MVTRRRQKSEEVRKQSQNRYEDKPNYENYLPKFVEAKTPNQKIYIQHLNQKDVIFCTGPSGTGKTFLASGIACEKLYKKEIRKIIVTRPLVSTGKEVGALPGGVGEKIQPYLLPLEDNFKKFLKHQYDRIVESELIKYEPLELMRGRTFDHSFMILDEAQNCTLEQIKMFITRIGKNSTVVINGDTKQADLYNSGLGKVIRILENVKRAGFIQFDFSDIQRNEIIADILMAFEEAEGEEDARR